MTKFPSLFLNDAQKLDKSIVNKFLKALAKKIGYASGKNSDGTVKGEKLDSNGVVTIESTLMNCIGLVSYLYNLTCNNDCKNFDKYSEFTELKNVKSLKDLKDNDIIWWKYSYYDKDNDYILKTEYHVSVWRGNNTVWESCHGYGVREKSYSDYVSWLYRNRKDITIRYYRPDYNAINSKGKKQNEKIFVNYDNGFICHYNFICNFFVQ